jgi:hypothetical protein
VPQPAIEIIFFQKFNKNIPKIKSYKPQKIIKIMKWLEIKSLNRGESEIL